MNDVHGRGLSLQCCIFLSFPHGPFHDDERTNDQQTARRKSADCCLLYLFLLSRALSFGSIDLDPLIH